MNPTLNSNRAFKDQVKVCLKNTFGPDTNTHIDKTSSKNDTRVLALVIFYESGKKIIRKLFIVLSCVIYTIFYKLCLFDPVQPRRKSLS